MKLTAYILAFYMMVGAAFPRTDFSQLLSLPNLIDHFQEHRLEMESQHLAYSLVNFLYEHYINNNGHEHSNDAHQRLPLSNISSGLTICLTTISVLITTTNTVFSLVSQTYYNPFHLQGFQGIFIIPPIQGMVK